MRKQLLNSALLIITAFIWGIAFVAQTSGGDAVGPFSFNGIRNFMGSIVLLPVIHFLDKRGFSPKKPRTKEDKRLLIKAGISCGIFLFLGSSLQQFAIFLGADTGKAGFMTATYILMVPLIGIFLKKHCGINVWIAVAITLLGLYLLCFTGENLFTLADTLLLLCALAFSIQILMVDKYSPLVDGVRLSSLQFLVTGLLSLIPMIFLEIGFTRDSFGDWISAFMTWDAWIPLLYAGILSCGVAYTLQIIGQRDLNPTIASLLMSLESVFAALAGTVLLGQYLTKRELIGCTIIFAAIIIAQLPVSAKNEKN